MRTCIVVMITLTSDKLAPIKVGFPIKNPVYQELAVHTKADYQSQGLAPRGGRQSKATSAYIV
jgi:hypothetical protein